MTTTTEPKKPMPISGLRETKQKGTNPKEEFGIAKVPMAYVPEPALVMLALAMKNGMKYGPYNYRKIAMQGLTLLDACKRHVSALIDGEDYDPKTGIPHAAFAMATLAIYIDCWTRGTLIDNRPVPGVAGELISMFNEEPGIPAKTPNEIREALEKFIGQQRKNAEEMDAYLSFEGEILEGLAAKDVLQGMFVQLTPDGWKVVQDTKVVKQGKRKGGKHARRRK